jgi:hypothetical protein
MWFMHVVVVFVVVVYDAVVSTVKTKTKVGGRWQERLKSDEGPKLEESRKR